MGAAFNALTWSAVQSELASIFGSGIISTGLSALIGIGLAGLTIAAIKQAFLK